MQMNPHAADFAINSYSYTLDHTAHQFLDKLADRGYREFELMVYPGHLWPRDMSARDRSSLRRHVEGRGLRLATLNMPNIDMNIAGASDEMRAYSLDLLQRIVELAGDLGAPGVIVGPGKSNPLFSMPRERLMGHFFAALDRLAPIAEKAGTQLYLENMPFAFLPGIDELLAALDNYGRPDIAVIYDVANGWFIKEDIGEALRKCARSGRLKMVHYSDTGQAVYRHDAIGLGSVPFAVVPPVLAEIGHAGRPMLEIISHQADERIEDSVSRLAGMGYGKAHAR
ncbi:MAG: sugar phosphate isomerase/epimerase [Hyphomicrobiaceae bacterium]|nr:sugar phosphate isomerase/epimerase [Hyphomicrobiaceae bacterium]